MSKELLAEARALDRGLVSEARDFAQRWQAGRERLLEMLGTLSSGLDGFRSHGTCVGQQPASDSAFAAAEKAVKLDDELAERALRAPDPPDDWRQSGPLTEPEEVIEGRRRANQEAHTEALRRMPPRPGEDAEMELERRRNLGQTSGTD